MSEDYKTLERARVLKSIEREKELKKNNLCRSCAKNKATTQDQMFTPICQKCRERLESGKI